MIILISALAITAGLAMLSLLLGALATCTALAELMHI